MFTKEEFTMIMTAIEKQNDYDLGYTSILSQVLKTEDVPTYDHSNLSNLLFALLQKQFVPIKGQCEIERYCWELNFGWADGNRVISYDDLWDTLISRQSLNTDGYSKELDVAGPEFVSNEKYNPEPILRLGDIKTSVDYQKGAIAWNLLNDEQFLNKKDNSVDLEARFEERVKKLIELGFVRKEEVNGLYIEPYNGKVFFYYQIKDFSDEQFNASVDYFTSRISSSKTASRFFPIDDKENYHEDDVHEVATASTNATKKED